MPVLLLDEVPRLDQAPSKQFGHPRVEVIAHDEQKVGEVEGRQRPLLPLELVSRHGAPAPAGHPLQPRQHLLVEVKIG